jgi:peptidoglycan/LPS O-acetylase OafA/YrhL
LRSTVLRTVVAGRPFVLLFFVLSGFVLSRSLGQRALAPKAYLVWVTQRSIRLMLPTAASVLLSASLYVLFYRGQWSGEGWWLRQLNWLAPPDLGRLLQQASLFFHSDLNDVLWSLAIEWRLSLAVPLMVWLARSRSPHGWLMLLALGFGLAGFAGGTWPNDMAFDPSWLGGAQSCLYFTLPFALGVALDRSGVCAIVVDRTLVWAAVFAVLGLARAPGDLANFLAAAVLIWLAQQPTPIRDILQWPGLTWLGTISFSLYLVHVPLLNAVFHMLHDRFPPGVVAVVSILGALPLAFVFYVAAERPARRLARLVRDSRVAPRREMLEGTT